MPASVSSVLRSAEAARKRKDQLEEDIASYEWQNSAQTAEDYDKYRQFLAGRANKTTDATAALSFQRKIDSARRAFTSNEIQRVAIDVLEGTADLATKQGVVRDLFNSAIEVGDMNLAQNLYQQHATIDVQIQREQEAAAKKMEAYADKMARAQVTSLKDLADYYLNSDDPASGSNRVISEAFKAKGSDWANEALNLEGTQYSFWDLAKKNVELARDALWEASKIATTDSSASSLQEQAIKLNNGESTVKIGGLNLSIDDLNDAADATRNGQNLFQPMKNEKGENVLKRNKVTNYIWGQDASGKLRIITTYNEVSPLSAEVQNPDDLTQLTTLGKQTKDKLAQAGYDVIGTERGLLRVRQTTNSGSQDPIAGSSLGESFLVTADGRVITEDLNDNEAGYQGKVFQIVLDDKANDFGTLKEVDAEAEAMFGDKKTNSVATQKGVDYINTILRGPDTRQSMIQGENVNLQGEIPGLSFLQGDGNPSDFLAIQGQNAEIRSANNARISAATDAATKKAEAALQQQMAVPSIQSNTANGQFINQLPVPAGARLSVDVAKPAPITSVGNAVPPTTNLQVVKPSPTPKVTVGSPVATPKIKV